jgi:ABC-type branched-subunit amino acid transport system substrate-binding protein
MDRHGNVGQRAASGRAVARVVKAAAKAAGLDHTNIAAHSLRSGFVTAAREAGAQLADIVSQTKQTYDTALGYDQGDAGATRAVNRVFGVED